ncbi:MAG: NADH dehydrogenase (quinone) subunit D [Planctomycetota bacterium]
MSPQTDELNPDPDLLNRELEAGWKNRNAAFESGAHHYDLVDSDLEGDEFEGKQMIMNFGPQHPATHGTLRSVFTLEGETIIKTDPDLGYLHTGFEKLGEHMTYQQWVTVTDRMNYLSAINNNVGYAVAVEELLGIEPPERCQVLRVIMCELSRIADHILCLGLQGMDLGAFSVMLWAFKQRERIYDIIEAVCGARLTTSWTRIGGLMRDVPDFFEDQVYTFLEDFPKLIDEYNLMLTNNRIFVDRLVGVGVLTREEALSWGVTGPIGRASGVDCDVRLDQPYCGYERYDFKVVSHEEGDCYARYLQRMAEVEQSLDIIRQALAVLPPDGPVNHPDFKVSLPEKEAVYNDMESLIHHFKLVMLGHGIKPEPDTSLYRATEAPCGELGYYIYSDGSDVAYRIRIRPASYYNYAIFPSLSEGSMISDAVAVLSSLHVIAGELDR